MASNAEFEAFLRSERQGQGSGEWNARSPPKPSHHSPKMSRPPQHRKYSGEQAPLLSPPLPQAMPDYKAPVGRGHRQSRSDYLVPLQGDPSHPFNRASPTPPPPGSASRPSRPPRSNIAPPPPLGQITSPDSFGNLGAAARKKVAHRRAKSDIPLAIYGSGDSVGGGRRVITKADLLKTLPSPRWGGGPKPMHTRNRSRSGSDGPLLPSDAGSLTSGGGSYGAISAPDREHPLLQSIGSVELAPELKLKRPSNIHKRVMSDVSVKSVTTDLAKSALVADVTETGRIRFQLPKDSFRMLMDSQLEAGCVYKRKLLDDEDAAFLEFHTVEEGGPFSLEHGNCHCTCERCTRCHDKQKSLPPDLYVMAVDSTIYRRMLDEVNASRTMPCGTFFCGHHDDVRHPDITIAALIVGALLLLLTAGAIFVQD